MSEAPPKEVTALGWSMTANIDGRRQIVFQSHIASDASDGEVNAMLDRANRMVDRMVALYELPDLREERLKLLDELSQYDEDKQVVDANHVKVIADADVQLKTLREDRQKVWNVAAARHKASGRGGEFKPRGHDEANIKRFDAEIQNLIDLAVRAENEKQQVLSNLEASNERRRARIAILDEKIAQREKDAS